jgi:hypothetical protein
MPKNGEARLINRLPFRQTSPTRITFPIQMVSLAMIIFRAILAPLVAFATLALTFANSTALAEENVLSEALLSIQQEDLKEHIDVLADDSFEGREAGSRGGKAAGGYILQKLTKLNVKGAAGNGQYYQPFRSYRNILGMIEGSDPQLKDRYILIGAHYDHVGYGNKTNSYGPFGRIHNGADDNASGISAILEIAEALTTAPEKPKRSIIFAFWDGEEKGLLGSKHWTKSPTIALDKIDFAINIDMIGRMENKKLIVFGTRSAPSTRKLVSNLNTHGDLQLDFTWEIKANSDHYSFFAKSVPVLMFHTGLHRDYHRPSDDVDRLNIDAIQPIARLIYGTTIDLANAPKIPFRSRSKQENKSSQRKYEAVLTSAPQPRFGISWRVEEENETKFMVVTRVIYNSPAYRSGIKVGDRVLQLGDWTVDDSMGLHQRILGSEGTIDVLVGRKNVEEPVQVQVTLNGKPIRLGVSFRSDPSEPGALFVTRVTRASPADIAGVKPRDRVYRIGGQTFTDSNEFLELARSLPTPVTLTLENRGQLREVTLNALPAVNVPDETPEDEKPVDE